MPGWSTQIASEIVRRAARQGCALDQMQLQKLVYIAHGWCLAITGQPLTGDRPEAWDLGPMYRRLADALAGSGRSPVRESDFRWSSAGVPAEDTSDLDTIELAVLERVCLHYGGLTSSQLSAFTHGEGSPWASVYGAGEGRFRDIPHALIRDQFVRIVRQLDDDKDYGRNC